MGNGHPPSNRVESPGAYDARGLGFSETELRKSLVSLFFFTILKFNRKTESRVEEEVGNVVDDQQVEMLEFALDVPQPQLMNSSFTR